MLKRFVLGLLKTLATVLAAVVVGLLIAAFLGSGRSSAPAVPQPETALPQAVKSEWVESISSDGLKQRASTMSFEVCRETYARTVLDLNIPPSRIVPIVNSGIMTLNRICLDDGQSLLIACSEPDQKMTITETPGGTDVGCPG